MGSPSTLKETTLKERQGHDNKKCFKERNLITVKQTEKIKNRYASTIVFRRGSLNMGEKRFTFMNNQRNAN